MAAAFPGPYVDLSLTTRGPFSQVSTAEDVKNPRDLGENRVYSNGRTTVRGQNLSAQQTNPKPFPSDKSNRVGYDPYANGGSLSSYLES